MGELIFGAKKYMNYVIPRNADLVAKARKIQKGDKREIQKFYDMAKFVSKVTSEKPRARVYIDDKGIRFTDWETALQEMEKLGIIDK